MWLVFLVVVTALVCLTADVYYRLLRRWCPPDPPPIRPDPVALMAARRARTHRAALDRYWQRHPFDQELE